MNAVRTAVLTVIALASALLALEVTTAGATSAGAAGPHEVSWTDPAGDAPAGIDVVAGSLVHRKKKFTVTVRVRDLRNRGRFQVIAPWWEAATVVDLRRAGGRLVVRSRWVDHTGASRPCPVRASWRSRKDVIRVVIPRRCGSTYGWANGEGGPALNVIARLGKQRERAGTFVVRQQWEAEHHTADWARRTFDEVLASVRSGTRATLSDQNLIEEEDWTRLWNRFGGAATSAVDCRAHDDTDGFPIIDCAVAQDGVQTNFYAYLHWTGGTSTGWRVQAVYFDV